MHKKWVWGLLLLGMIVSPFAYAATSASTPFIWNVPSTRSYSITYGGSCTSSNFFFNEPDANFDPDNDGNAAKVPPSSNQLTDENIFMTDYNFVGITNPSSTNFDYNGSSGTLPPPTSVSNVNAEISSGEYSKISTANDNPFSIEVSGKTIYLMNKSVYKVSTYPPRIQQLIFHARAAVFNGAVAGCTAGGTETDLGFYTWNYASNGYEELGTYSGGGEAIQDTQLFTQTFSITINIPQYISPDNNIVFMIAQIATDGVTNTKCLNVDFVDLNVIHYPDSGNICQNSSTAPMLFTNNGNVDINADGNFSSAFSGTDVNLVLKVWQGTGSGCGSGGFGGWEKDCTTNNALTDLNMVACRQFNSTNATANGRLVTKLLVGDSNQLCYSGDINAFVKRGTYAKTFRIHDFNT